MHSNKWLITLDVEKATRVYEKEENAQALHDLATAYVEEIKLIEKKISHLLAHPEYYIEFFKTTRRRFTSLANAVLKHQQEAGWYDDDRFEARFNNILCDLYDVADERVDGADSITYKFIWVKTF